MLFPLPLSDLCFIKKHIMNRKDFIRKSLLGTGLIVTPRAIDKMTSAPTPETNVGFNHLPNQKSNPMTNTVLHKAATRGHANHGWLDSHHTFSFANYHNPDRMHFGALRVLNDDRVDAGMGFGRHRHDNMEIISIPLEGDLEHQDSMGNTAVIRKGDIQVMSAGTGIYHSEYNRNQDRLTKFLQIWVIPNQRNVPPRYDQITLDAAHRHNKLQQILSPNPDDAGVWIHQDAWFHLGIFEKDFAVDYTIHKPGNGVYAFVLKGDFTINGIALNERDGLGIWEVEKLDLKADSDDSEILLMEVPMVF